MAAGASAVWIAVFMAEAGFRMIRAILAEMTSPLIANLEKLLGTPRDGALLRYSLGSEYLKAGSIERGIEHLREAVRRDPQYSAAWKALGRAVGEAGRTGEESAGYPRR